MTFVAIRPVAATLAAAVALSCAAALAQQPAPPKPYKKVEVTLPAPIADPSFDDFRKQLAEVAQRKDREALIPLIVPRGFFWERESGNGADEKKTGIENLAAATGLDAADGSGWDMLADYAAEPSASAISGADMICAPASPNFSEDDLLAVIRDTDTSALEWGYPTKDGIEARETAKPDSKVTEKLGLHFIRVVFDDAQSEAGESMLHIVTPSGKLAFIPADSLLPVGVDQLCYAKQDGSWKIMGYVGEGNAPQ